MKNTPNEPVERRSIGEVGERSGVGRYPPSGEAHRPRILSEDSFHAMIAFERKRSDRFPKAYALILVAASRGLAAERREKLLWKIAPTLLSLTRETDLPGWYKTNRILGVIFTDIVPQKRNTASSILLGRVGGTLRENLTQEQLSQISITIQFYPEDGESLSSRRRSNPTLYPDLDSRDQEKRLAIVTKRAMDIVGGLFALVLSAPLLLVVAIAIKSTSKGPVFFRQERVGQYGKPFVMLKFRSMDVNNDTSVHKEWFHNFYNGTAERHPTGNGGGTYKLPHDPRVTRVGRFLRRTSLDEVPQFLNVLKGEMSLVGPRPPIPYEVDAYQSWHRGRILQAKPGITGLWQVSGRSRVNFDEMVRLDLRYARTWSIWLDIKILLKTPAAVLFGEGAY